jgi:predicted AAA+ superfamily ATPase
MKYIKRNVESTIKKMEKMFTSVLITGARQVGKTTTLRKMKKDIQYITLDDPLMLQTAIDDPGAFFKTTPPPVIVDEIQYAPQLLTYIKMIGDETGKKGQFYLTGSQKFHMMKNVSESLAGRIGIINLLGLSLREIQEIDFKQPFLTDETYIIERNKKTKQIDYSQVWKIIHQGSMPALYSQELDWKIYYGSYTRTYIERDVRDLTKIGDEQKFIKFMIALAARTSQMLNMTTIANEVGVTVPTAERWLSILISSNIIYPLQPYYNNITKRTVKTPKIYFLDTGLAAYLTRWSNSAVLESGAMAGAFFETFVFSEILKSHYNTGTLNPPLYYYRDKDGREIDLLIEQNGILHPIEIKKSASPRKEFLKHFKVLDNIKGIKKGTGGIVCLYDDLVKIDQNNWVIPVNVL